MMSFDSAQLYSGLRYGGFRCILAGSLALGSLGISTGAWACSTGAWDNTTGGTTTDVRYVDLCAYAPGIATPGDYVEDTGIDSTNYIASFYALVQFDLSQSPDVSSSVTIFEASTPSVSVAVRGNNTAILTTTSGPTSSVPINTGGNYNGWNHFKLQWTSGGTASLSINGGTPVTVDAGSGTLSAAKLGHIASASPKLFKLGFDEFVSLRQDDTALTSPLCPGDVNDTETRTFADANIIYREVSGGEAAPGQADFNGDGRLTFADANLTYLAATSGQRDCP